MKTRHNTITLNYNVTFIRGCTLIAFFLLSIHWLSAQELKLDRNNSEPNQKSANSKHSINLEIGGRTLLIASLNYEYLIRNRFSLSAGLGFNSISKGKIIRNNEGITETGSYFDLYSAYLFSGTYHIGKNKHKLLISAGLTHFRRYQRVIYPSEKIIERARDLKGNAGIGYQFTGDRMYYRVTAYLLALPHISVYAPDYLPWIGLTAGYKF